MRSREVGHQYYGEKKASRTCEDKFSGEAENKWQEMEQAPADLSCRSPRVRRPSWSEFTVGPGIPGEPWGANWRLPTACIWNTSRLPVSHPRKDHWRSDISNTWPMQKIISLPKASWKGALKEAQTVSLQLYMCAVFFCEQRLHPSALEIQVWSGVIGTAVMSYKRRFFRKGERDEKSGEKGEIKGAWLARETLDEAMALYKTVRRLQTWGKIKGRKGRGPSPRRTASEVFRRCRPTSGSHGFANKSRNFSGPERPHGQWRFDKSADSVCRIKNSNAAI